MSDKLPHVIAYSVLAILFASVWRTFSGPLSWRHLGISWALLVLYGIFDELTQTLVGRHGSVLDWLADVAGIILGLAIFSVWNGIRRAAGVNPSEARG
jgi:VanZ family protein